MICVRIGLGLVGTIQVTVASVPQQMLDDPNESEIAALLVLLRAKVTCLDCCVVMGDDLGEFEQSNSMWVASVKCWYKPWE